MDSPSVVKASGSGRLYPGLLELWGALQTPRPPEALAPPAPPLWHTLALPAIAVPFKAPSPVPAKPKGGDALSSSNTETYFLYNSVCPKELWRKAMTTYKDTVTLRLLAKRKKQTNKKQIKPPWRQFWHLWIYSYFACPQNLTFWKFSYKMHSKIFTMSF